MSFVAGKRVLLIISGGIAAYKCLELIRRLKERAIGVRCILTDAATHFVTPLSVSALAENKVYTELFSLNDESEMGHIRLSRDADLLVVAPASADILARMACGIANDLATTALLATDKPVLAAPAMNVRMWQHPATQANLAVLSRRGMRFVGPNAGDMACGEFGPGRMAEPDEILAAIEECLSLSERLKGKRALVTSGPTREPIDPVRYLSNHSSGRQGHEIASALARLGAQTTLVSGPTERADPFNVQVVHIETADQMLKACQAALPVDVAVCAAAVCDWRVDNPASEKTKKTADGTAPRFTLTENPDILATLSAMNPGRPRLVIGFAAETARVIDNACDKRLRKGCDWIVANDVSPATGTFGGDSNTVHVIDDAGVEHWPTMTKAEVADRLALRICETLEARL
ncbi:MAG: bifunctional phosphopantothenoylcysteine decarboxylase/phosphopantothenate--cysteine ligase CoaBC [Hyphomicrobiales bacterium]|nr:bifunctional phosphopantothenoylcysteine decarboxylase/phosphopantothenate--cysteine ligase CoaBC [Hyphomicrobiales bacterium]